MRLIEIPMEAKFPTYKTRLDIYTSLNKNDLSTFLERQEKCPVEKSVEFKDKIWHNIIGEVFRGRYENGRRVLHKLNNGEGTFHLIDYRNTPIKQIEYLSELEQNLLESTKNKTDLHTTIPAHLGFTPQSNMFLSEFIIDKYNWGDLPDFFAVGNNEAISFVGVKHWQDGSQERNLQYQCVQKLLNIFHDEKIPFYVTLRQNCRLYQLGEKDHSNDVLFLGMNLDKAVAVYNPLTIKKTKKLLC